MFQKNVKIVSEVYKMLSHDIFLRMKSFLEQLQSIFNIILICQDKPLKYPISLEFLHCFTLIIVTFFFCTSDPDAPGYSWASASSL